MTFRRTGKGDHVHTPDQTIDAETGEAATPAEGPQGPQGPEGPEGPQGPGVPATEPTALFQEGADTRWRITADQIIGYGEHGGSQRLILDNGHGDAEPFLIIGAIQFGPAIVLDPKAGMFILKGFDAAPVDGFLPYPGSLALWFDKTPGAAKLMIKAKDADGNIVTGSLNLT